MFSFLDVDSWDLHIRFHVCVAGTLLAELSSQPGPFIRNMKYNSGSLLLPNDQGAAVVFHRSRERAHQEYEPATRPDRMTSVPETYIVEGEN